MYYTVCTIFEPLFLKGQFVGASDLSIVQLQCTSSAVAQWSEHLQLKQEAPGLIPRRLQWVFFSFSWLANVDEMNYLWCSSTVWLLSTQT